MKHSEIPKNVVRLLKGAPAAILLAQVLHGSPQTVRMLCGHTDYSDKVVRQGLSQLESMGLAYRDRELRAWYLVPGTEVLALLRGALETAVYPGRASHPAGHSPGSKGTEATLSTELSTGAKSSRDTEETAAAAEEYPAMPFQDVPPVSGARSDARENAAATGEDFTGDSEGSSGRRQEKSVSRAPVFTTSTTTNTPGYVDQEAVSKHARRKQETDGRDLAAKENGKLMFWLSRGGIGPGSPKMREIMALDPDLETVKAHVLERLACVQGEVDGASHYGVGLLIRKLLDGDPPPPMRCETCLELPNQRGWCRCDYDAVVIR